MLAAMPFSVPLKTEAFTGMRKGEMAGKGLAEVLEVFGSTYLRPQVDIAGCAAAASEFFYGFGHCTSWRATAGFCACAQNTLLALRTLLFSTVDGAMGHTKATAYALCHVYIVWWIESVARFSGSIDLDHAGQHLEPRGDTKVITIRIPQGWPSLQVLHHNGVLATGTTILRDPGGR